jgi:hypothetical protein
LAAGELWLNSFAASDHDAPLQTCLTALSGVQVRSVNQHPRGINLYDKGLVRRKAAQWSLPLPPGEAVELAPKASTTAHRTRPLRAAIERYLDLTGRVIIRGAFGASGSSVFVVGRDKCDLRNCLQAIAEQRHTDVYVVEPFLDVVVSPNVGMFIDPHDGAISCLSVSDQIMDDQVRHVGNQFPSQARFAEQMVAASIRACRWLRDHGTTGFLGFDFCEYRVPGNRDRQFFFAELNPRFNAATYPTHLLARLNDRSADWRWRAFRAITIETSATSFGAWQAICSDLFFDGREAAGLIPYNVGMLRQGKLMVAMIGETSVAVDALQQEVFRRSAREGHSPRDSQYDQDAA